MIQNLTGLKVGVDWLGNLAGRSRNIYRKYRLDRRNYVPIV